MINIGLQAGCYESYLNDQQKEKVSRLKDFFNREKDYLAILHRIGLFGNNQKTFGEIGNILQVSGARALHIFRRAQNKLCLQTQIIHEIGEKALIEYYKNQSFYRL